MLVLVHRKRQARLRMLQTRKHDHTSGSYSSALSVYTIAIPRRGQACDLLASPPRNVYMLLVQYKIILKKNTYCRPTFPFNTFRALLSVLCICKCFAYTDTYTLSHPYRTGYLQNFSLFGYIYLYIGSRMATNLLIRPYRDANYTAPLGQKTICSRQFCHCDLHADSTRAGPPLPPPPSPPPVPPRPTHCTPHDVPWR